jgi:hypothetical protein
MDLEAFAAWTDETAAQLLGRCCVDPVGTGVFFIGALRAGHVLEVSGPSGSAKTETLVQVLVHFMHHHARVAGGRVSSELPGAPQVAAACILPKQAGGVALGYEGAPPRQARAPPPRRRPRVLTVALTPTPAPRRERGAVRPGRQV